MIRHKTPAPCGCGGSRCAVIVRSDGWMSSMPPPLLIAVSLTTAVRAGGCGTVVNVVPPSPEDKTFGGVRFDVEQVTKFVEAGPASNGPSSTPGGKEWAAIAIVFAAVPFADLPLSFVGDMLTFP